MIVHLNNSWWPDGQIFRSKDSGATWSALWTWGNYPDINKNYAFTDTLAPWLGPDSTVTTLGTLQIGWMMESEFFDPVFTYMRVKLSDSV